MRSRRCVAWFVTRATARARGRVLRRFDPTQPFVGAVALAAITSNA